MTNPEARVGHVATLIGVVGQLFSSRMETLLADDGLTLSQFALLNHLARHADVRHTIAELTAAMEMQQPGVSKNVRKLEALGLIDVADDPDDRRRRRVGITRDGHTTLDTVAGTLGIDVVRWFADWPADELAAFERALARLAGWLAGNRLPVASAAQTDPRP